MVTRAPLRFCGRTARCRNGGRVGPASLRPTSGRTPCAKQELALGCLYVEDRHRRIAERGEVHAFNALTKASVPAENYPFCTIDPSVGIVGVPDARPRKLAELSASAKIIPAAIEFVDIAGLVKGASTGEGLGNQFLANIRETDAILQVVRFFDDPNVLHVEEAIEPYKDIEIINLELVLADAEQVRKRRDKLVGDLKSGDKKQS